MAIAYKKHNMIFFAYEVYIHFFYCVLFDWIHINTKGGILFSIDDFCTYIKVIDII